MQNIHRMHNAAANTCRGTTGGTQHDVGCLPVRMEAENNKKPPLKRNSNPGVRIVGCRLYDSVNGQTCHWCRQKTVEDHVQCSRCPIRFCGLCLKNRHGEDILVEMYEGNAWVCPKCRSGCGPGCNQCCNCGPCRKAQGLHTTGVVVHQARNAGFTNVHDYLIFMNTGESSFEIARRKIGRAWCRSADHIILRPEEFGPVSHISPMTQASSKQLAAMSGVSYSKKSVRRSIKSPSASSGDDLSSGCNDLGDNKKLKANQQYPAKEQNVYPPFSSTSSSQSYKLGPEKNCNPRVRMVGCHKHDSVKWKSCHGCHHKTPEDHVRCCSCTNQFCGMCLKNKHGEDIRLEMQEGNAWVCPKCRNGCGPGCTNCCNCATCRKEQGLEATGNMVHLARSAGFTNLHDYLIFKNTGESARDISRRKEGRGWCKSDQYFGSRPEELAPTSRHSPGLYTGHESTPSIFEYRMRGSLNEEQVKQLPKSYLPTKYHTIEVPDNGRNSCQEDNMGSSITDSNLDKISQNDPAFSSSIHSRLSDVKPLGAVLASEFNSSKPPVQLFSPDTCSLKATNLSSQERNGWLSLSQPVVNIDPHVSGSRSLVKMKAESSVIYTAFSRDVNDAIWSKHEDFKVPSAFQNQADNFGIAEVGTRNELDTDMIDEDYKFFLENVRVDGLSYTLDLKVNPDGHSTSIKFEEAEDGWGLHKCFRDRTLDLGLWDKPSRSCENNKTYMSDERQTCILDWKQKHKLDSCVASESQKSRKRKLAFTGKNGHAQVDLQSSELPVVKKLSTLEACNQKRVKEEASSPQASSPSDVTTVGNIECGQIPFCMQSDDFKKHLEVTVQKPFNAKEFHEMWSAINHRKPIVRFRHMRQRTIPVETKEEGFSYLDYHPELNEKLASAASNEEKLTLLRGFFFWLKHVSWPGAFQPWVSLIARKSGTDVDGDDCVEVDGPDCEVIAVVLPVDERKSTTFSQKQQPLLSPKLEVKKEKFQRQEESTNFLVPMNIKVKNEIVTC